MARHKVCVYRPRPRRGRLSKNPVRRFIQKLLRRVF